MPASVTQGYAFSFTISVAGTLAADLPITLELDDGSNGIIAGMSPGTYTADGTSNLTIPQAGSQVVTITTNAGAGNVDQNISISLSGGGSSYTIGTGSGNVLGKHNTVTSAARPRVSIASAEDGFSAG